MTDPYPALITWRDAHAVTHTWTQVDELDDEPCIVRSVGWLLPNVKSGHLVLAQSHIETAGDVDHVLAIPAGMVIEVTRLNSTVLVPVEPIDSDD